MGFFIVAFGDKRGLGPALAQQRDGQDTVIRLDGTGWKIRVQAQFIGEQINLYR